MITLPWSMIFALPMLLLLVTIVALAAFYSFRDWKIRRHNRHISHLYRCTKCAHVYVDVRDVPLTHCPRCGCANEVFVR